MLGYFNDSPYAIEKGISGTEALREHLRHRQELELHIFRQEPQAIVIACSDSRVMPNSIFSADLGDLFVIRAAGNVLDNHQLGSIEYAAAHLGVHLIIMLGHTERGA